MARCGCTAACGCSLEELDTPSINITITGTGSPTDPYVISADGHTHDGTGGATSLVVGGLVEGGPTVPTATTAQSIAIGDFANASGGLGPIAIGSGTDATTAPSATSTHAIAIGGAVAGSVGARATGAFCIAIGGGNTAVNPGANASGAQSIAIGNDATADSNSHIAIGTFASALGGLGSGVAIGTGSTVSQECVGIGNNTNAQTFRGIAIGSNAAMTVGVSGIAIGGGQSLTTAAFATATTAIAIGANDQVITLGARASGAQSVAIGGGTSGAIGASATAARAIAIGSAANASQVEAISIGSFALSSTAVNTVSIGGGADATRAASATGLAAIAIGSNNTAAVLGARASGAQSVAIGGGTAAQAGASASGAQAIAIGRTSVATHANAVALGDGVSTTNTSQVNIGIKRIFAGAPTTAPAAADLVNSQVSFYQTEANDALGVFLKESGGATTNNDIFMGVWPTFTPVWTQGAVVTATVDYSRFHRVGRHINHEFHLTATGAGTAATIITVSIPFTATGTVGMAVGSAWFRDATTGIFYAGTAFLASATTIAIHLGNGVDTAGLGAVGSTFVLAIAAGDTISGAVTFEATT